MSTTARIYFAQDAEALREYAFETRIIYAQHQSPAAVLWVVEDGYPRGPRGGGVLDEFELFLTSKTFTPATHHARMLAGQFVWFHASSVLNSESDLSIFPTVPTVGAIVSWEYLIICHPDREPTVRIREGLVWQKEKDFLNHHSDQTTSDTGGIE